MLGIWYFIGLRGISRFTGCRLLGGVVRELASLGCGKIVIGLSFCSWVRHLCSCCQTEIQHHLPV